MVALAIVALPACGKDSGTGTGTDSAGAGTAFVAGDGSIVVLAPGDRVAAPTLVGQTLAGEPFSSADFAGDVLVVNVWASWCSPCRAEAATLERISTEFAESGVQFVGLNTRDSDTSAQSFVAKFGITYPNVVDRDGLIQLGFRDSLPPQAIPSTLVVDRKGRVAARVLGEVSEASLRAVVEDVSAEPAQ